MRPDFKKSATAAQVVPLLRHEYLNGH